MFTRLYIVALIGLTTAIPIIADKHQDRPSTGPVIYVEPLYGGAYPSESAACLRQALAETDVPTGVGARYVLNFEGTDSEDCASVQPSPISRGTSALVCVGSNVGMRITKVNLVDAATHENVWFYDVKKWVGISRFWPGEKWDCGAADVAKHVKQFLAKDKTAYSGTVAANDRPETALELLHLGISLYGKDPAQALDYFQQAKNVAPSGPIAGPAMTWQAMLRQHQEGGAPAAETLYRAALATEEASSPEKALTMESLAHFLREQGRVNEAEAMESSAGKIRRAHVAQLSPKRLETRQASIVGNDVTAPTLLHKIEPSYSLEARLAKVQGTAVLSVVIGTDGKAVDVQLLNGLGYGLDEQALDAITQWSFKPGMRTGVPVPVQASIDVNFRLGITQISSK